VIAKRLRAIVDTVFDGNVSAAAQVADVPVPTLHRILDRSVESPRIATLRTLADGLGVPLGWLLGDLTTEQAQEIGPPGIPEALWLIIASHSKRQNALRARIAAVEPHNEEGRRLKRDFEEFNFLPFTSERPLIPALDYLSTLFDSRNERDLRVVRHWADFSTMLLESALQKLKSAQSR
jgi:transcriptional regulator with XRE-family HTH domain